MQNIMLPDWLTLDQPTDVAGLPGQLCHLTFSSENGGHPVSGAVTCTISELVSNTSAYVDIAIKKFVEMEHAHEQGGGPNVIEADKRRDMSKTVPARIEALRKAPLVAVHFQ